MRHIIESIIGKRGSYITRIKNPKLRQLRHLDVVKTRNNKIYICLDKKSCTPTLLKHISGADNVSREHGYIRIFDAYTCVANGFQRPGHKYYISSLGLNYYDSDLTYKIGLSPNELDIVEAYRGILDPYIDRDCNLDEIWDYLIYRSDLLNI
jgi:hypothetical protein